MNRQSNRVHIVSALLCFGAVLIGIPWCAQAGELPVDTTNRQSMKQVIEQYIRAHPEVIEQLLQALEAKREAKEKARQKVAIATRQNDLLHDPSAPVSGNPKG